MYNSLDNTSRTNIMVKTALLSALSVILTRFFAIMLTPTLRIGFGSIPLSIAGILFGPVAGAGAGLAADLIGVVINSQGKFHPGFMLSSALEGFIPGAIFFLYRKRYGEKDLITPARIFSQEFVSTVVISLVLNTFWLSQLYGKGYFVLLPVRAVSAAINLVVKSIITYGIVKQLYKY